MKILRIFLSLILTISLFPAASHVLAQTTTATLNGTVTDTSGGLIPGASVTITSTSQRLQRHLTTGSRGEFTFPLLSAGGYRMLISHPGFAPVRVSEITLGVNDTRTLDITLRLGPASTTVLVNAQDILLNTSPSVQTSIDKEFIQNLPLSGRSIQSLLLLVPGVLPAPLTAGSGGLGQFSVNGQRTDSNNFTVDGVSANTSINPQAQGGVLSTNLSGALPGMNALGTTSNLVSVDALDQFTIQTSTYSAEFGRQSGGQIQLATRTGANNVHGAVFDYLRNEFFDARSFYLRTCSATSGLCQSQPKLETRQNIFGGNFSGPLVIPHLYDGRSRTFFFFSYEGERLVLPNNQTNIEVPSVVFRQQVAAAHSPVAALLNAYPLPNSGTSDGYWGLYNGGNSTPSHTGATSIRVDHNMGSSLQVYARYSYSPSFSETFYVPTIGTMTQNSTSATLGATYTITPHIVNEAKLNYTRSEGISGTSIPTFAGSTPVSVGYLTQPFAGTGPRIGGVSLYYDGVGSSFTIGDAQDSFQRQIEFSDNLTIVHGRHSLKAGFDYRGLAPIFAPTAYQPSFGFYAAANVLSSTANYVNVESKLGEHLHYHNYSAYLQDSWKLTDRLTVTPGIRWDLNPPPTNESGLNPALVTGVNNLATATLASANTSPYKTYWYAVAPRFGMSYVLNNAQRHELVVRGGVGIYFDQGNSQASAGFSSYPFLAQTSYSNVSFPLPASYTAISSTTPLTLPTYYALSAINPQLSLPLTVQWNAAMQQSIGRKSFTLTYTGSSGQRLITTQQLNGPINNYVTGVQTHINPNFTYINYTYNGPSSIYHALQAQFVYPLGQGFQLLANYTWSHSIDDNSDEVNPGTFARASSDFDIRSSFTNALIYNIPSLKSNSADWGTKVLKGLANGWQLEEITIAHTGTPADVTLGATETTPVGTNVTLRPDLVPNVPLWVPVAGVPGKREINVLAFAFPPYQGTNPYAGEFLRDGTTPRNYVRLSGLYQFNTGVKRTFPITKTVRLEFKAEQYNLTNHPTAGYYRTSYQGPTTSLFGQPSAEANSSLNGTNQLYNVGGPRSMQFSGRIQF